MQARTMDWITKRAVEARQLVGAGTHPTERDLLQLAELAGVTFIHAAVPCPYCTHTARGPVIVLPHYWRGDEDDWFLAHEVGHALLKPGGGNLLRFLWPGNPRIERLARLWDSRDEAYADHFADAWHGRALK